MNQSMNVMKKILFLSLFFNLNSYGQNFLKETVYLPFDLASVKVTPENKTDKGVKLDIEYIKYPNGLAIKPSYSKNSKTIESFFANLFKAYQEKDFDKMLVLFDQDGQKKLKSLDKNTINKQFSVLALITDPKILSLQKIEDGFIVWWKDSSFRQERKVYLKKINEEFKVSSYHAVKDDDYFWNSSLFLRFTPFSKSKPKLVKKFDSIKDGDKKTLEFLLNTEGQYLNLFKENDTRVNLVAIDNYDYQEYVFKDLDKEFKKIKLIFSGENFKKAKTHRIFYIESSYPLGLIDKKLIEQSDNFTVVKE